jgi:integrase/recombinase XerD
MLISEAYNLYFQDKKLLGYSKYTLKSYTLQSKLLIKYFGDIEIEAIEYIDLKNYLLAQNHLKPASLGHRIRFIKSLFHWGQDEGLIIKNPSSKLKEPKIGSRIPKYLTEEEIELIRDACISPLEHCLVEFLYSTGCRVGEVYKLNTEDINFENKSLIVDGKGDKQREVYFTTKCHIWLSRYLKTRKDNGNNALFVTERSPHRMSIAQMRYIIKRIAKRAEIKSSVFCHRFRHSLGTHMLNNRAPMEVIQSILGHSKASTTAIYAQLCGQRRKELYQQYFR